MHLQFSHWWVNFFGGAKVISFLLLCPFVFRSSAKGPVIIYRGWRGGGKKDFGKITCFSGGGESRGEIKHRQQNTKMGLEKVDCQWTAHEETGGKDHKKITESGGGSGKSYFDTTKILWFLPSPPPRFIKVNALYTHILLDCSYRTSRRTLRLFYNLFPRKSIEYI